MTVDNALISVGEIGKLAKAVTAQATADK